MAFLFRWESGCLGGLWLDERGFYTPKLHIYINIGKNSLKYPPLFYKKTFLAMSFFE